MIAYRAGRKNASKYAPGIPLLLNDEQSSPHPALLRFFFADQTGHPGLLLGGSDDPALRREARNFANKLGPDRFLEFFAILDRYDEGARPSDHAVLVIEIEILDIDRSKRWLL